MPTNHEFINEHFKYDCMYSSDEYYVCFDTNHGGVVKKDIGNLKVGDKFGLIILDSLNNQIVVKDVDKESILMTIKFRLTINHIKFVGDDKRYEVKGVGHYEQQAELAINDMDYDSAVRNYIIAKNLYYDKKNYEKYIETCEKAAECLIKLNRFVRAYECYSVMIKDIHHIGVNVDPTPYCFNYIMCALVYSAPRTVRELLIKLSYDFKQFTLSKFYTFLKCAICAVEKKDVSMYAESIRVIDENNLNQTLLLAVRNRITQ